VVVVGGFGSREEVSEGPVEVPVYSFVVVFEVFSEDEGFEESSEGCFTTRCWG